MMNVLRFTVLCSALAAAGCGGDDVDSDEAARAAYIGLDGAVEKALGLGMDGFNAATSANIPPQMTTGDVTGTLTVSGQVDSGASDNKEMRLLLDLAEYRDEVPGSDLVVRYDTMEAAQPMLDISLRGLPSATFTGTLTGTFYMEGDIEGAVNLSLTLEGMTEPNPDATDNIRRVVGTTHVTGTATSSYGTFNVDVTI